MTQMRDMQLLHVQLAEEAAGAAALLSALERMGQSTRLNLLGSLKNCAEPVSAYYAAVSGLTSLVNLQVPECIFPSGLWRRLHTAGLSLPRLAVINLDKSSHVGHDNSASMKMSSEDLTGLVNCCPCIASLSCNSALSESIDYAPLKLLQHLTQLSTNGVDDNGAAVVAELTALRDLCIHSSGTTMTDAGLLGFTGLTQLSCLFVCSSRMSLGTIDLCDDTVTVPPLFEEPVPEVCLSWSTEPCWWYGEVDPVLCCDEWLCPVLPAACSFFLVYTGSRLWRRRVVVQALHERPQLPAADSGQVPRTLPHMGTELVRRRARDTDGAPAAGGGHKRAVLPQEHPQPVSAQGNVRPGASGVIMLCSWGILACALAAA